MLQNVTRRLDFLGNVSAFDIAHRIAGQSRLVAVSGGDAQAIGIFVGCRRPSCD